MPLPHHDDELNVLHEMQADAEPTYPTHCPVCGDTMYTDYDDEGDAVSLTCLECGHVEEIDG